MKRRSLLTMIPATSALLAIRSEGKPVPQPALTQAGFAIAVQCWSFRKFTWWEAVEKAAAAGASGVEIYHGQPLGGPHGETKVGPGLGDAVYASMVEHCAKNGIVPVNMGVVEVAKDEAKARQMFEMAKALGLYGITTESSEAIYTL